jgi:hypothetical protein
MFTFIKIICKIISYYENGMTNTRSECPDIRVGMYPKLKTYVLELILDSYENIPAAYVTMICII